MSVSNLQPQPRRAATGRPRASQFGSRHYANWLLLYALFVAYGSLVLGPFGYHFVPQDPAAAWHTFLATPFLDNGSDQRPDWIANLLMMVPFGLLATGAFGTGRGPGARILGTALALLLSLGFLLAIKYGQVFFPPRTVSLNYIIAQSIGAALGVGLFHPLRAAMRRLAAVTDQASRACLVLDAAIFGFVAFALFPFDIALSTQDLAARFAALPSALLSVPDAGRPLGLRVVLLAATAIVAMPLGMRLCLRTTRSGESPRQSRRESPWEPLGLARIAVTGAALLAVLFGASLFILSAKVSIATFGLRLLGVVAGAMLLRSVSAHDPRRLRYWLDRALPFLLPIYLLLLVYANGLLTRSWVRPEQALAGLNLRGLLPLWYDYISSKSHALQSTAVHAAMYAPLGVMVWLRRGGTSRTALAAATLGGLLALMIELGRGLKPGLQPDVTIVLIGAIAAAAANRVMQMLWPTMLALPTLVSSTLVSPTLASPMSSLPAPSFPTPSFPTPSSPPPSSPTPSLPAPSSATLKPPIAGPSAHAATRTSPAALPAAGRLPLRMTLAILCLAAASVLAWRYPLGNWQAPLVLVVWLVAMWLRPVLWFVLLPAIMPALDLAPWTGWIAISEADIAVLATVAVLLLRAPPTRQDIWPSARVHLFPRLVLALVTLAWLIGIARGFSMTANFPGGSDNPYLIWLNTVRLAKPFLCALLLLPFMRARQREHGDAALLFSIGMLAGLALVGLAALAEHTAFTSLSDIHDDYRITATFSSMHVGGGHIGAYLAFAMPFLVVCLLRPRLWTLVSLIILLPLSGYTLAVTFARTAYLATFASMVLTCCAWMIASRRRRNPLDWVGGALIAVAVAVALVAGLNTGFMRARMSHVWANLAIREANWGAGLDRRDSGVVAFLLGMGTGSYPRFAALRSPPDQQPGTYVVRHDGQRTFLATMFGPDFYFGQKVQVVHGTTYTAAFDMRAPVAETQVRVLLCTKLLLYSADCHILHLTVGQAGVWQHVEQPLQAPVQHGRLPAPVDLSFATGPGTVLDLGNVQLIGPDDRPEARPAGGNIVANGDFAAGTARWFFTSDDHWLWRILDSPLSIWFEGGVLGTAAVSLLVVSVLGGAARAIRRGEPIGAPIAGAMLAVLLCGCFDNIFEAPRIALLFDLVAMLGLMLGWPPSAIPTPGEIEPPVGIVPQAQRGRIIHV
ncbi:MAG TPA: VanZ family protein [Acetobacteraceae bacterium]|jgi:VanZ family protein|nr:VanZ family protein [Acetobacteraceae bacterium]